MTVQFFRPGMNASADIKTKRHDNVVAAPIGAVNSRGKGSDKSMAERKKEQADQKQDDNDATDKAEATASSEMEEVAFVLQPNGTVKKVTVKVGIQDINYYEVLSGLKPGDEVVTAPYNAVSEKLKDGMKVKVVSKEKLFEK